MESIRLQNVRHCNTNVYTVYTVYYTVYTIHTWQAVRDHHAMILLMLINKFELQREWVSGKV